MPATSAVAEQITRASGKRARTKASSATPSGGTATLPPMRASAAANAAQGSASGRSKDGISGSARQAGWLRRTRARMWSRLLIARPRGS